MTLLDEIALVYRFIHAGETYRELGAQYQLSEKYVSVLVQNGIWILALLYGTRYIHPFTCQDILAFTPVKRREVGGQNVFLAGDCVESVVNDCGASPISRLLFSSKVHTHTIKLFIFVTEGGVIIDRSFVLGGGAAEVAGAHHVLESAAFLGLVDTLPPEARLVLNLDRGFGVTMAPLTIPQNMLARVREWIPAYLNQRSEFLPSEIAESMVRISDLQC
jgi:hypothetical protein